MWLYRHFTNNIYATKNYTYHNLRSVIQNKDIVAVKGDKDSSVDIMKKSDVTKLDTMIHDSIMKGIYVETTYNTLKELSPLQVFLYSNFHNYERYIKICNLIAINQYVFMEQLKPTNLKL